MVRGFARDRKHPGVRRRPFRGVKSGLRSRSGPALIARIAAHGNMIVSVEPRLEPDHGPNRPVSDALSFTAGTARFRARDGTALACRRRGAGPPLVLVHGSA